MNKIELPKSEAEDARFGQLMTDYFKGKLDPSGVDEMWSYMICDVDKWQAFEIESGLHRMAREEREREMQ